MARRMHGPIRKRILTEIVDVDGEVSCATEFDNEVRRNPADNAVEDTTRAQNITLVTGETWNPNMSAGQHPVMLTGICDACREERPRFAWMRRPNRHGLANVKRLKICASCGRPICPRHARRSNGSWRCPRCHRHHAIRRFFGAIFFEAE